MVRPGSGRFEVGFWVGFWVGLRARDSPTEEVLSRTPLIIRTVDQSKEDDIKFALLKEKGFKLNDTSDDSLADIGILFIGDLFIYHFFFILILFSGNRQIPGLATGAVGHSLFYSRR